MRSVNMSPFVVYTTRRTALHCASYGGFADTMSLLLESQANPNLQDNEVGGERECKVWGQLDVMEYSSSTTRYFSSMQNYNLSCSRNNHE